MEAPSFDRFKNGFFDRPRVIAAVGSAAAGAMGRAGSFVRQTAKRSLRYRDKASKPGQPPSVHRDDRPGGTFRPTKKKDGTVTHRAVSPLKEFIFFAFDQARFDVIVGPAATNQLFFDKKNRPIRGTVPSVLEQGGEIRVFEVLRTVRVKNSLGRSANGRFTSVVDTVRQWSRADLRSRRRYAGRPTRFRTIPLEARPFMMPALEKEAPNFAPLIRIRATASPMAAFTSFIRSA